LTQSLRESLEAITIKKKDGRRLILGHGGKRRWISEPLVHYLVNAGEPLLPAGEPAPVGMTESEERVYRLLDRVFTDTFPEFLWLALSVFCASRLRHKTAHEGGGVCVKGGA
jgi:hypothetical protein